MQARWHSCPRCSARILNPAAPAEPLPDTAISPNARQQASEDPLTANTQISAQPKSVTAHASQDDQRLPPQDRRDQRRALWKKATLLSACLLLGFCCPNLNWTWWKAKLLVWNGMTVEQVELILGPRRTIQPLPTRHDGRPIVEGDTVYSWCRPPDQVLSRWWVIHIGFRHGLVCDIWFYESPLLP